MRRDTNVMLVDGTAPTATAQKQYRAIICLENWEMPGNLTAVGELTRQQKKSPRKILSGKTVHCLLQVSGYIRLLRASCHPR